MPYKLSLIELNKVEMVNVNGGCLWEGDCGCACSWEHEGGSSSDDNCSANRDKGLVSPECKTHDQQDLSFGKGGG